MFKLALLVAGLMLVNPSKACESIEVMICTSELGIFDSLVLEDGSPDVASICGREAEFAGLADKCEAQARICDDNAALTSIANARTRYANSVNTHCKVEVVTPAVEPPVEPVIEEEIVPEIVVYNQCNFSPTRLVDICQANSGGVEATCQNVEAIKLCIRSFAAVNRCSVQQMRRFERRLARKLSFICSDDE